MTSLVHHFKRDENSRHSEWLRQRKWFIKAREDKERREHTAEKLEDDLAAVAVEATIATETQIRAFEIELEKYETATVTALMVNQQQLDAVNARIEALLAQAYVMEDGRRVFKTEDGTQVFDEFGTEVSPDELDFDLIGDDRPSWEAYQGDLNNRDKILSERNELTEYQEKLDAAREKVASGEMIQDELEDLREKLREEMPNAVRAHVPDMEEQIPVPDLTDSFSSPAELPAKAPMVSTPTPDLGQP